MSTEPDTFTEERARQELAAAIVSSLLIDFGAALDEAQGGLDWPYFLAKPWKWAVEYVVWANACNPSDVSHPGWDAFAEAVQ